MLPPAARINEGVVDRGRPPSTDAVDAISQPHRTQTMPSASVVLSHQSSSLRMLELCYYHNNQCSYIKTITYSDSFISSMNLKLTHTGCPTTRAVNDIDISSSRIHV